MVSSRPFVDKSEGCFSVCICFDLCSLGGCNFTPSPRDIFPSFIATPFSLVVRLPPRCSPFGCSPNAPPRCRSPSCGDAQGFFFLFCQALPATLGQSGWRQPPDPKLPRPEFPPGADPSRHTCERSALLLPSNRFLPFAASFGTYDTILLAQFLTHPWLIFLPFLTHSAGKPCSLCPCAGFCVCSPSRAVAPWQCPSSIF